jgi:site-specific recombinase XerD
MNQLIQQQLTEKSVDNNIEIGLSHFNDDEWDLSPLIQKSTTRKSFKKIDFRFIKGPNLKETIKLYAYYRLSIVKPQTVVSDVGHLRDFAKYCYQNNITSFKDLSSNDILSYVIYLKELGLTPKGGYNNSIGVENIIKIGQVKGWNVPQNELFKEVQIHDLWEVHKNYLLHDKRTKPIPREIFNKILHFAINKEKDVLTKSGIIIQSQTGLRISEVLSIQAGCLHSTDDGHTYMIVSIQKTEKGEPIPHKIFVNNLVIETVNNLAKYTEEFRKESGLKELFIKRSLKTIMPLTTHQWSSIRLRSFIKRWDIRDQTGDLYHLTSHQFRATFVRELIIRNIPIGYIMKQFSHVSIEMTAHYLSLKEEEVKAIYSDIIFNPNSKIAGKKAKQIKSYTQEQFRGKTANEIDAIIKNLAKTMSFNPLPTGVCLFDFRRGNCSDGDGCYFYNCPNYLSEAEFYPILKSELTLIEKEMERYKGLGRERDWQRQYVKWKDLKPIVTDLEEQINAEKSNQKY